MLAPGVSQRAPEEGSPSREAWEAAPSRPEVPASRSVGATESAEAGNAGKRGSTAAAGGRRRREQPALGASAAGEEGVVAKASTAGEKGPIVGAPVAAGVQRRMGVGEGGREKRKPSFIVYTMWETLTLTQGWVMY
jgi:hypothetical protein